MFASQSTARYISATAKPEPGTISTNKTSDIMPFWNMANGATMNTRFTPDGNPNNPKPYLPRYAIKVPFDAGVVGGQWPTDEPVTVTVPSMATWGMPDYIQEAIRSLWKSNKPLALLYWHRPTFIFQGFVVSSPMVETNPPENPIRLFMLNRGLFDRVDIGLNDADCEYLPTDPDHGRDFRIIKGSQGSFANYSTSTFSPRERALSDVERAAVEKYGLRDLSEQLGTKPDAAMQAQIKALYHDSREGLTFDAERYPEFRAYPVNRSTTPTNGNGAATARPPSDEAHEASAAIVSGLKARNQGRTA